MYTHKYMGLSLRETHIRTSVYTILYSYKELCIRIRIGMGLIPIRPIPMLIYQRKRRRKRKLRIGVIQWGVNYFWGGIWLYLQIYPYSYGYIYQNISLPIPNHHSRWLGMGLKNKPYIHGFTPMVIPYTHGCEPMDITYYHLITTQKWVVKGVVMCYIPHKSGVLPTYTPLLWGINLYFFIFSRIINV